MTPILLCCGQNGRAVIFGYVDELPEEGDAVTLHRARMVLYWDAECKGLLGLAACGPKGLTRMTPEVPAVHETVWQEWVQCTAGEELSAWPA